MTFAYISIRIETKQNKDFKLKTNFFIFSGILYTRLFAFIS